MPVGHGAVGDCPVPLFDGFPGFAGLVGEAEGGAVGEVAGGFGLGLVGSVFVGALFGGTLPGCCTHGPFAGEDGFAG